MVYKAHIRSITYCSTATALVLSSMLVSCEGTSEQPLSENDDNKYCECPPPPGPDAATFKYNNIYGPQYGNDWIFMTGDDGIPRYVNLTELPGDPNGRVESIGNAYFYLFTRKNPLDPEEIKVFKENKTVTSQFYNSTNDVKVITHGWQSSWNTDWIINMKEVYLKNYDINVIAVDWSGLADNILYPWSAFGTRYVGKNVAIMLDSLQNSYNVNGSQMHLIGHSLGAQVMGYAGSYSNLNISRITGLDPARPLFEIPNMGPENQLERSDAEYVDIIHTCGGLLGYKKSFGHADFYPNDGSAIQPGCGGAQHIFEACSHGRSHELFTESIDSTVGFVSYPCESWEMYQKGECNQDPNLMGDPIDTTQLGNYYLTTNAEPKYARG